MTDNNKENDNNFDKNQDDNSLQNKKKLLGLNSTHKLNTRYKMLINNAYEKYQNEDYVDALAFLKNAVEIDTNRQKAYFYLGLVYLKTKQYQKAVKYFKKAYENNKNNRTIYCKIIENIQEYDLCSAVEFAEFVLEDVEDDNILYLMLATLYSRQNEDDKADKYFLKSISLNPEYYVSYCDYVTHLIKVKNYDTAIINCKKLITLKPDDLIYYSKLSELYLLNNKKKEAIKVLEQYESIHKIDLEQYEALFYLYKDMEESEIALKFCKKAIWSNSKDIDIYKYYIKYIDYVDEDTYKESYSEIEKVCNKCMENCQVDTHFLIGFADFYSSNGDNVKAMDMYKRVLELDKNNIIAKEKLQNFYKMEEV